MGNRCLKENSLIARFYKPAEELNEEEVEVVDKIDNLIVGRSNILIKKDEVFMDNYSIGQSLGIGYFGETRKCKKFVIKDEKLVYNNNNIRAVKILLKSQMGQVNSFMTKRFFHEMKVIKSLDHPNILKTYECYED